jgi:hypothetical protein
VATRDRASKNVATINISPSNLSKRVSIDMNIATQDYECTRKRVCVLNYNSKIKKRFTNYEVNE